MSTLNRKSLKNFFKKGSFPTEVHFADLIDSSVNIIDDGFGKSIEDGLQLSPQGTSTKLISFYESMKDVRPAWYVALNPQDTRGLSIGEKDGENRLFLQEGGNVGIGTLEPQYKMDVKGFVGMEGRMGTYRTSEVPADAKWHTILANLNHIQAYEIMALAAGQKNRGRYALVHAIALSTYGSGRGDINQTQALWGNRMNRIQLRWKGSTFDYSLQIRTRKHYGTKDDGTPYMIKYRLSKLWESEYIDADDELKLLADTGEVKLLSFLGLQSK